MAYVKAFCYCTLLLLLKSSIVHESLKFYTTFLYSIYCMANPTLALCPILATPVKMSWIRHCIQMSGSLLCFSVSFVISCLFCIWLQPVISLALLCMVLAVVFSLQHSGESDHASETMSNPHLTVSSLPILHRGSQLRSDPLSNLSSRLRNHIARQVNELL